MNKNYKITYNNGEMLDSIVITCSSILSAIQFFSEYASISSIFNIEIID